MMSVLVALTATQAWAAAAPSTSQQTSEIAQALTKAKARAIKHAPRTGDFVDATAKKTIGTVVRPMNGDRKAINTNPATSAPNTVAAAIDDTPGIGPLKAGDYTFPIALKNTMTAGRKDDLETVGGKNYSMKNELIVSAQHSSGWGLGLSAAMTSTDNADKNLNVFKRGDASIILDHPSLIKNDTFSMGGKFRAFLPTTESSRSSGFRQYRYLSITGLQLAHKFSLSQVIMPIVFSSTAPASTDSPFFVYQCLELAHQTTKSIALSIGEQTQVETHYGTEAGTTVEIYPFIDFALTKNILIEPKFYVPIYVYGSVDGAPSTVSLNQTQAELFVKLSI